MLNLRAIEEADAKFAALNAAAAGRESLARGLEEVAKSHRDAIALAREVENAAISLGRPSPLVLLVEVVQNDAKRIADGFARSADAFDELRRGVLVGSWSTSEVAGLVLSQAQIGRWLFDQLTVLVGRLEDVSARAQAYFDRAFERVHADPTWNAKVAATLDADGKPRGSRLADVPKD
jgi:hypothetical protein